VFWVISVYFNIRNTFPKSGTFLLGHPVFYLPGDKLSSTDAARHVINVEPGTEPINTRPYRLPETQKLELDKQVKRLLWEGIIEVTISP